MKKKIQALFLAATMILSLTACNSKSAGTVDPAGDADDSPVSGSLGEWDKIDRDLVVAYVDGAEDPEAFNITFGEFYSEYLYYLLSYGIDDDTSATYKSTCDSFREDIISYLQFERIFLKVAEEMGVGLSSLTAEELNEIEESAEQAHENFRYKYYSAAVEELGDDASAEAIANREEELLTADLSRAELTTDIFLTWEKNAFVQEKLLTKLTENIEITETQVDEMFDEYVQMAKDALTEDPLSYEANSTYTWIYIPEGTRLADQILLIFDDETMDAISEARTAGNDEEADRIRDEAYESGLKERAEELITRLNNGEDFNTLQAEYNDDSGDDPYAVIVGAQRYVPEFTEAVFSIEEIGGISEPSVSDYGVHIIRYEGDAFVSDEDIVEIKQSMKEFLISQETTAVQERAYEEWLARFPYMVEYETLRLDDPNVEIGEDEEDGE
ncbi:MAG: peptidylprolyl isomerase [Bacteroides sp.]|nr:peptidylprolyl isomerase [Eubacterium sp.]MCM1417417.1 peptidylprolyl isomerase [Roseburia sp.]MCM1461596.1 peptidylprolyl isomerase [Bacteroides sp.]